MMLSGTMDNVVKAQQMILERIANISDRLKDMVSYTMLFFIVFLLLILTLTVILFFLLF